MIFTGMSHGRVSRVLCLVAIAAVATLLCPPVRVSADGANFPFFCRGPFAFETNDVGNDPSFVIAFIFFKTASKGAGVFGENLHSGECAWANRPTKPLEGNALLLHGLGSSAPPAGLLGFVQVTQCSMNKDCIAGFSAFSGNAGLEANMTPIDTLPKGDTTECGIAICIP